MAVRVVLAVEAEFLRMVLHHVLRRMPGVEVLGDAATIAAAAGSHPANAFIVTRTLAAADPQGLAVLCDRHPGRVVLLCQDGQAQPLRGAVQVQLGATPDPATLASRLRAAIAPWTAEPGRPAPCTAPPAAAGGQALASTPGAIRIRRPDLVVIAASTGGPEALKELFAALHPPTCPVVIALHIPAEHCEGLVRHLGAATGHVITVGQPGPLRECGTVLLPGGVDHGVVERDGALFLRRAHGSLSVFHPNGDVLLTSAAALGRPVAAVVLTGMGDDGRAGASALAARGYPVLVQSPASCAVPGMPGACIAAGAAHVIAPPAAIAERLNTWFSLPRSG